MKLSLEMQNESAGITMIASDQPCLGVVRQMLLSEIKKRIRQTPGMEKEIATHSSILAWRIPWTEDPGGLQSTGSQRIGHD